MVGIERRLAASVAAKLELWLVRGALALNAVVLAYVVSIEHRLTRLEARDELRNPPPHKSPALVRADREARVLPDRKGIAYSEE